MRERGGPVALADLAAQWMAWHADAAGTLGADEVRHVESGLLEQMRAGCWPHALPSDYRQAARAGEQLAGTVQRLTSMLGGLRDALPQGERERLDALLAQGDGLGLALRRFDAWAPSTAVPTADWAAGAAPRTYVLTFDSTAGSLAKLVDWLAQPDDAQRKRRD